MKKYFICLILVVYGVVSYGQQSFVFRNTLDQATQVQLDYSLSGNHFLGEEIANKTYLLKKIYTHIEKGTPMSPVDKVIVKKPTIYYSVRKLERHFRKEMRKDNITEEQAREKLNRVLDICISIYDQDTDEFEDYLKKQRKPEDILAAYDKVVLD